MFMFNAPWHDPGESRCYGPGLRLGPGPGPGCSHYPLVSPLGGWLFSAQWASLMRCRRTRSGEGADAEIAGGRIWMQLKSGAWKGRKEGRKQWTAGKTGMGGERRPSASRRTITCFMAWHETSNNLTATANSQQPTANNKNNNTTTTNNTNSSSPHQAMHCRQARDEQSERHKVGVYRQRGHADFLRGRNNSPTSSLIARLPAYYPRVIVDTCVPGQVAPEAKAAYHAFRRLPFSWGRSSTCACPSACQLHSDTGKGKDALES
ncbi:hypothetical protein IWX46DRAFT_630412 [Phyllosticta citricarpa]|uniref:Uncharacterized protein n=1 Tax=Phyllosticta citricarpa TaxID=55181 RepID=A0ABR1LBS6_9PEZI